MVGLLYPFVGSHATISSLHSTEKIIVVLSPKNIEHRIAVKHYFKSSQPIPIRSVKLPTERLEEEESAMEYLRAIRVLRPMALKLLYDRFLSIQQKPMEGVENIANQRFLRLLAAVIQKLQIFLIKIFSALIISASDNCVIESIYKCTCVCIICTRREKILVHLFLN